MSAREQFRSGVLGDPLGVEISGTIEYFHSVWGSLGPPGGESSWGRLLSSIFCGFPAELQDRKRPIWRDRRTLEAEVARHISAAEKEGKEWPGKDFCQVGVVGGEEAGVVASRRLEKQPRVPHTWSEWAEANFDLVLWSLVVLLVLILGRSARGDLPTGSKRPRR